MSFNYDALYVQETTGNIHYTNTPTGQIAIERALDGRTDFWISPALTREKKQKKLMISDWTAPYWSDEKRTKLISHFNQFLHEGFHLYVWSNRTLKRLTQANIQNAFKKEACMSIKPASPQDIYAVASEQQSIPADQVYLFDDYQIESLYQDNDSITYSLYVSHLVPCYQGDIEKIIAMSIKKYPNLSIIHDVFDASSNTLISQLREKNPNLNIQTEYQSCDLSNKTTEALFNQTQTDAHEANVTLYGCSLTASQLPYIKNLTINSEYSTIDEYISIDESILHHMCSLERITLNHTTITNNTLIQLLKAQHESNIKTITLNSCPMLSPGFFALIYQEAPEVFRNLEKISISHTKINQADLQVLLTATSQLKELAINNCAALLPGCFARICLENPTALKNLEKITLYEATFNIEDCITLLNAAPQLKEIVISDCCSLPQGFLAAICEKHPAAFQNLEKIRLLGALEINSTDLCAFLKTAPHLKELPQSLCESLSPGSLATICEKQPTAFQNLEEIDFSELPDMNQEDLRALFLRTASNLKVLDLSESESVVGNFLKYACANLPESLKSLEKIDLSDTAIDDEDLNALLNAAPHLKEINLSTCEALSPGCLAKICQKNPTVFKNLEKIDLSYTSMNDADLHALLSTAPNLRKINLSSCENLSRYFLKNLCDELPEPFKKLEAIDLGNMDIDDEDLLNLLEVAPHLKNIDLFDCNNLSPGCLVNICKAVPNALKHLEIIVVTGTSAIRHDDIPMLLKAAPYLKTINSHSLEEFESNIQTAQESETLIFRTPNRKKLKPNQKPFVYSGQHNKKNQSMVIEKLSQYATFTNALTTEEICKIQDGICAALTCFFKDTPPKEWDDFLTTLINWDGRVDSMESVRTWLNKLCIYVKNSYFSVAKNKTEYFLGVQLALYLRTVPVGRDIILMNPWHAIAVRKTTPNEYIIYDPNDTEIHHRIGNAVAEHIQQILGELIAVEAGYKLPPIPIARIHDWPNFLQKGGLLLLCRCRNLEKLPLPNIGDILHLSKEMLEDTLLTRNTKALPAWLIGMNFSNRYINQLTALLLEMYKDIEPCIQDQLKRSIEDIPNLKKHLVAEGVLQKQPQRQLFKFLQNIQTKCLPSETDDGPTVYVTPKLYAILINVARPSKQKSYEEQLMSRMSQASRAASMLQFCQELLNSTAEQGMFLQKTLIDCPSTGASDALFDSIHNYCRETSRPVMRIETPEELICSAAYLARDANQKAIFKEGPGGALFDFLSQSHDHPSVLLVHLEQFKPDDIIRFNGLCDKEPHADGTKIPNTCTILAIRNVSNPDVYDGADFTSRFEKHVQSSFEGVYQPLPPISSEASRGDYIRVNLFHAPDWKTLLLGQWVLGEDGLYYQEGPLKEAIDNKLSIDIQNGLWGDRAFERFWQKIRQEGIWHAGKRYHIPADICITQSAGYPWATWTPVRIQEGLSSENLPVLNDSTFVSFFKKYTVHSENQSLIQHPGILEMHKNSTLSVHMTSSLHEDTWARLLAALVEHGITLKVYYAPGVTFPADMQTRYDMQTHEENIYSQNNAVTARPSSRGACDEESPALDPSLILGDPSQTRDDVNPVCEQLHNALRLIESMDIDATIARITNSERDWYVINISESAPNDVLCSIDGRWDTTETRFFFHAREVFLQKALERGQKIILCGSFPKMLVDSLAEFLIERAHTINAPGKLILIPQDIEPFSFLPRETPNAEDILALLGIQDETLQQKIQPYIENQEPFSRLQTRMAYLTAYPEADSNLAWQGMEHLHTTPLLDEPFDIEQAAAQAKAFTDNRIRLVEKQLERGFAFLTGLSGVGKTTFVYEELCKKDSAYLLFSEETGLNEWIKEPPSGKTHVLFIDEANLSPRQWSMFEGLFQANPCILLHGALKPLSANHKIIFAGNPISYGDERKLAPFFQRHGGAVLFEPLSQAVIYDKILRPMLQTLHIQSPAKEAISRLILQAYIFIANCSTTTELLISPRELEMMMLLAYANSILHTKVPLEHHVKAAIVSVGSSLLQQQPQDVQQAFLEKFSPESAPLDVSLANTFAQDFLITDSRKHIAQQIQERLNLQRYRKEYARTLSPAVLYGGLGGLVITGEPGEGKSEIITAVLRQLGYHEKKYSKEHSTPPGNLHFYRMPVSMGLDDKKALLIQAWHTGAVVVIDEMNSAPMIEKVLNALLTGKHPDTGMPPANPGFMVLGTQNPATNKGRRLASTALLRRMTSITMPSYTHAEKKAILIHKGITEADAEDMIKAYQSLRANALQERGTSLCFRDLLKLIRPTIAASQRQNTFIPAPSKKPARLAPAETRQHNAISPGFFSSTTKPDNDTAVMNTARLTPKK